MSSERDHKITDMTNLKNLHVYILKSDSRYFGYPSIGSSNLREFTLAEVEAVIENAFGGTGNVFLDSAINPNTMCIVVPDNWDNLMPAAAQEYLDGIEIVPFVYFLHPGITQEQVQFTRAPADAAYQLEYQKIMNPKLVRVPQGKIRAINESPQSIQNLLRLYGPLNFGNALTLQAPTPDFKIEAQPLKQTGRGRQTSRAQTMDGAPPANRRMSLGPRRRSSLTGSSAMDSSRKDTSQKQKPKGKPSWTGQMESMDGVRYADAQAQLGLDAGDELDYQKAWQEIRARSIA